MKITYKTILFFLIWGMITSLSFYWDSEISKTVLFGLIVGITSSASLIYWSHYQNNRKMYSYLTSFAIELKLHIERLEYYIDLANKGEKSYSNLILLSIPSLWAEFSKVNCDSRLTYYILKSNNILQIITKNIEIGNHGAAIGYAKQYLHELYKNYNYITKRARGYNTEIKKLSFYIYHNIPDYLERYKHSYVIQKLRDLKIIIE